MSRRKWLPCFRLGVWLQLLPLLIMYALLWGMAWTPFHLSDNTVKFWEYLIYGWVYAAAVYLLGLALFARLRASWLAMVFAGFYFLLYAVNAGFLNQAGEMLTPYFFWAGSPAKSLHFLKDYFTGWVLVIAALFFLNTAFAAWLVCRYKTVLAATPLRGLLALAVLCWGLPILRDKHLFKPTAIAVVVVHAREQGAWRVDQTFSLRLLAENPYVAFGKIILNRPQPLQARPASELSAVADALKKWQLPLGPRHYAPLPLKPFDQIVMFGTESLSLDFFAPYNTNLPAGLSSFYSSPEIVDKMFVNYRCVALPTQPGLSATYNSQPNSEGLLQGDFEQSLLKVLDAAGYDTYFLTSEPETFLNDDILFKRMGFKHVIGSLTWMKDPRFAPYVAERGLMDRKLYELALDYLAANQGKKIFIQIMSEDTHGPYPRADYGDLSYPPYPAALTQITNPHARAIMAGNFRHDYDIGQALKEMRQRSLLTTNTLVILTADHNYPPTDALDKIPGYPQTFFARIPLAFLSGQTLPPANLRQLHSQLDFAPTVAHLLNLPIPEGWWGESIFATNRPAPVVSDQAGNLTIIPPDGGPAQIVSLEHPQGAAEKELITLFNSVYTNPPAAAAADTVSP